jgi:DNA polymerase-3 subunit alpha
VAQIATFGTMAARAAIKDVGRVLDVPLDRVNQLTNLVPKTLHITLDEALAQEPDLKKEYDTDPQVRQLIDIARKLEGTNRQTGIHAAGVVIANGPLTDYVPVHRAVRKGEDAGSRGSEPVVATQWVMGDLEKVGLLKMDFLGLRTLTLLENAVRLIKKTRGETIDLYKLPLDDPETYALLQRGDAKGVFQLENDGIRELSKRMKPDNFRDIIATIALYRPGPLQGGLVDAYVNRKHGREKPTYPHPVLEEILGKTFGIMVYQEDVMRILNRLGGIDLSSAYACIKAISKKKQDIIEQRRAEFLNGAVERGVREETAREIFDLITYFGGYGFNASHSAAYAMVAYQTAYLKTHYTPEFMAALLSSEIDDGNKRDNMVDHIADARRLGVDVLPPDLNASEPDFTVVVGKVLFGLTAIKGIGRGAAEEVVRARAGGGRFRDFFDFCERVDSRAVTRGAIERLIKAGACDALGRRAQLWHVLPRALQAAGERQQDRRLGQRNLFEDFDDAAEQAAAEALPDVPEWPDSEKLKNEKEALDFYFSSHPLAQHEDDIRRFASHSVGQVPDLADGQEVVMGGMLTAVRFRNTQKARNGNSRYALCSIEDFTGSMKCVMWPDDLARHKDDLYDDRVCFIRATVNKKRDDPVLVLTRVMSIEEAQRELTRGLALLLRLDMPPELIDTLGRALQRAPGACPVYLTVKDGAGKRAVFKLSSEYSVNPATVPVGELEALLGPGAVKFSGPANGNGR